MQYARIANKDARNANIEMQLFIFNTYIIQDFADR